MAKKKTVNETPRARFGYLLYDEILLRIEEGKLDSYDIVYTKDTRQCFIITPELKPMAIHSRVYVFGSIEEAIENLNTSVDTYIGQVVSILDGEVYRGYIVNKGNDGKYFVTPLYEHPTDIDYNTLGNKPIENKIGTYNHPIILNELETGMYNISGKYKVTSIDETEYLTGERRLVLVNNMGTTSTIKVVTADGIINFIVSNNEIISDRVVTESYLKDKGYTTETYVEEKIKELDIISRNEIDQYIENYISTVLGAMIDEKLDVILDEKFDEKFDERFDERFQFVTDEQVYDLFDSDDDGVLDFLES